MARHWQSELRHETTFSASSLLHVTGADPLAMIHTPPRTILPLVMDEHYRQRTDHMFCTWRSCLFALLASSCYWDLECSYKHRGELL